MANSKKLTDLLSKETQTTMRTNAKACQDATSDVVDAGDKLKGARFEMTCAFVLAYHLRGTTANYVWGEIAAMLEDKDKDGNIQGVAISSDGKHDVVAWVRRLRPVAKKLSQGKRFKLILNGSASVSDIIEAFTASGHTSFAKLEAATKEDPRKLTGLEQAAADDMIKRLIELLGDDNSEAIKSQLEQVVRQRADQQTANAVKLPTIDLGSASADQATGS